MSGSINYNPSGFATLTHLPLHRGGRGFVNAFMPRLKKPGHKYFY